MPWQALLIDAALVILTITALTFVIAGVVLCLRPSASPQPEPSISRFRGLLGLLEKPQRIERFVYRHHRWSGAIILLGAGISFWRIATSGILWPSNNVGLHVPLLWLLAVATALAFLAGLVILIRPSGLKPVEARANRWVGPEAGTLREWLSRHPRIQGLLVLAISLYALLAFGALLMERAAQWWVLGI